jgi:hypothetical protein
MVMVNKIKTADVHENAEGKRNPHTQLVGLYISPGTMELSMEVPQNNKTGATV